MRCFFLPVVPTRLATRMPSKVPYGYGGASSSSVQNWCSLPLLAVKYALRWQHECDMDHFVFCNYNMFVKLFPKEIDLTWTWLIVSIWSLCATVSFGFQTLHLHGDLINLSCPKVVFFHNLFSNLHSYLMLHMEMHAKTSLHIFWLGPPCRKISCPFMLKPSLI
jgi:hypothetical protein